MSTTIERPPNLQVPQRGSQVPRDEPVQLSARALVLEGPVPVTVAAELLASLARDIAAMRLYSDMAKPLPARIRLDAVSIDMADVPHLEGLDAPTASFRAIAAERAGSAPLWDASKSDVYRLGLLFVEMVTGADVYEPVDHGVAHVTWLTRLLSDVCKLHPSASRLAMTGFERLPALPLVELLKITLAFDPEDRPSLDGFADELDVLAAMSDGPDAETYLDWVRRGGVGSAPTHRPSEPHPDDVVIECLDPDDD